MNGMLCALAMVALAAGDAANVRRLCDFETPRDLKMWEVKSGTARLVSQAASHGRRAMEIAFDPKGRYYAAYLYWRRPPRDWSAYDALALDVFNPNPKPIAGYVLVADEAWRAKGATYWNRHNGHITFAPGRTRWVLPVRGLFRGEAGSRNNDIKRNIDPDSIVRVDFGFGRRGSRGRVVIDNLRFIRARPPRGVWAFDFGPPSQSVMIGWTPVSHETRYTRARGFGWGPRGGAPWNGAARDTTFGTMLTQDFCEARGYNFHIDAPPGEYRVAVIYENAGYWGGEQAMHRERRIFANGRLAWSETRPDGPAHALYRFENVELVGKDIWDTYMKAELVKPAEFDVRADRGGVTLRFDADRPWGSKVSAVVVRRKDDRAAEQWIQDQWRALAEEFRSKAVCLDAAPRPFQASAAWRARGCIAWPTRIEATIAPNSAPPASSPEPERLRLEAVAARGAHPVFCLAVRPLQDLGECRWTLTPFEGPGRLPARVKTVFYNTSRGFNSIAYHIRPHTLREVPSVRLAEGVTREVVVVCRVPADARPGVYRAALSLARADGREVFRAALSLDVRPVTLDRGTDFLMGFYGLMPPRLIPPEQRWSVLEKTLALLREYGMNAVSGGPSWRLKGWRGGEPVIDFGDMDRFFALLRRYGFTRPLNGYGGARFLGLHDRYEKGRTGRRVEQQSGLPYSQALLRAWRAVDAHARAHRWPVILYAMCDETRVRAQAERQLAFMKMMAKVSAAFPRTLRTSGSYSVHFRTRPANLNDMLYWHQRFFEALDISCLNLHDPTVMSEARRLGKEVHIYNQGRTRFSFGLYQWCEYRRGVRARWQWHLNILHGYQFFDLDGREPDTAMICYGRRGLYPTIHFERCRQGAEDFYLYNTLYRRLRRCKDSGAPAAQAARALLRRLDSSVKLNQRRPPAGYDPEALNREVVDALEALPE